MTHLEEVEGIVLYQRKHRERDYLVKILTDRFGKIMFFVRGSKRPQGEIYQAIRPYTKATFIADIKESGLSFLRGAKDIETRNNLQLDIFKHAYATYICALADAAINDFVPSASVFSLIDKSLDLINMNYESKVISNIAEVKFLTLFGVGPNFTHCVICGKKEGIFDYSDKYHGILCSEHFYKDHRRLHVDPKALHLVRLYSFIKLEKIGDISIKNETQIEIKRLIDHLYNETVGLNLKSKKFIDNLYKWEDSIKNDN